MQGDFYRMKIDLIKNGISNSSELSNQRIYKGSLYKSLICYKHGTRHMIIEVRNNENLISRNRDCQELKLWQ